MDEYYVEDWGDEGVDVVVVVAVDGVGVKDVEVVDVVVGVADEVVVGDVEVVGVEDVVDSLNVVVEPYEDIGNFVAHLEGNEFEVGIEVDEQPI